MSPIVLPDLRGSAVADAEVTATLEALGVECPPPEFDSVEVFCWMRSLTELARHNGGPLRAELLAVATETFQELVNDGLPERHLRDLAAELLLSRGWALISEDRPAEAAEELLRALRRVEGGTGDPLLQAHIYEGSARIALLAGETETAIGHLDRAIELHRSIEQTSDLVSVLFRRSTLWHSEDSEAGEEDQAEALEHLECGRHLEAVLRAIGEGERPGGTLGAWVFGVEMELAAAALMPGPCRRVQGETWAMVALAVAQEDRDTAEELLFHARFRLAFDLCHSRPRVEEIDLDRPSDLAWSSATLDAWRNAETPAPLLWSPGVEDATVRPRSLVFARFHSPTT